MVGISHPMDLVLFDPFQTKAVPMEDGMIWQHFFGQGYERIRPASLNPAGVM